MCNSKWSTQILCTVKTQIEKLPGSWECYLYKVGLNTKNSFPGHVELQGKSWIFQSVPPEATLSCWISLWLLVPKLVHSVPGPAAAALSRQASAAAAAPPAAPAPWAPEATQPFPLVLASGSHRGAGPGHRHHGDGLWLCLQDQEGDVPHRGAALQGVPHQADGHAPQHQPQLRALHHPQPREEGMGCRPLLLLAFYYFSAALSPASCLGLPFPVTVWLSQLSHWAVSSQNSLHIPWFTQLA